MYQQQISDDSDRQNRFASAHTESDTPGSLRERAASQPPRGTNNDFLSAPHPLQGNASGGGSWLNAQASQRFTSLNSSLPGLPQSVPIRSASFSSPQNPQAYFASVMRETRTFPSTFEDDESEALSDAFDDNYLSSRGRSYAPDLTRSRSQSLATPRPGPVGSGFLGRGSSGLGPNWQQLDSYSNPLSIPGNRFGDIQPPGTSRYGSLGVGRSPQNIYTSSPSGSSTTGNGYRQVPDISNVSPFVRDVGQILLDDGSAFRELWAGMHPPRDENGGGGSGSTSRRHSVSVVQARRPTVVGFSAPGGGDGGDDSGRSTFYQPYGGSGLLLTDDDLAADLGSLTLAGNEHLNGSSQPRSQPSSLPMYAPLSRSPASTDRVSPYQALNLNIPGNSFATRQVIGSPNDANILSGGGSPRNRSHFEQGTEQGFATPSQRYSSGIHPRPNDVLAPSLSRASFSSGAIPSPSPISPNGTRQNFAPAQIQRGPSESGATATDLGKGVPLHSVPSHWHLYIIEFKAGRTDLFYSTDVGQEIRVGDIVIVEADRGKDLGKVVNDTITLAEVEAFQKQQAAKFGYGEDQGAPMSPGATGGSGKKDINPKRIFAKAQAQDIQLLQAKVADEERALELCRTKARQKKLPMEVIDAEFQWDRRKLTFYFIAEKRIDFRELVRELFRVFKTRIWLSALSSSGGYEQ